MQEYDKEAPEPNARRVYIAYLDSVEYFRPRLARTRVYHELLSAYLLWSRLRGFERAHIWACPPQRGNGGFIFWCHPLHQKTPSRERLLDWYRAMVERAQEMGAVSRVSDLYQDCFLALRLLLHHREHTHGTQGGAGAGAALAKAGAGAGSVLPTGLLDAPDSMMIANAMGMGMGGIPPTPLPTPVPSSTTGPVAAGAGGAGGKKQASVAFAFPPFLGGAAASERQLRREREREKKERDRERRRLREKQRAAARKAAATGVGLGLGGGVTTAVLPASGSGVGMELETTTTGLDGQQGEEGGGGLQSVQLQLQKCVAWRVGGRVGCWWFDSSSELLTRRLDANIT